MVFRVFVKTPLFWSIFLLFGVVFNYHAFDLGETYVSRNLGAWAVIFLSLIILWWRPFRRGELAWTPLWLAGLLLPAIGGLLVLVVNIWGGFEHFHVGHYFLPVILLTFGLFVLGLIQHQADFPSLDLIAIIVFIAFLPQYGTYLVTENPFFASLLPLSEISVSPSFYKASAGFGQYNFARLIYCDAPCLGRCRLCGATAETDASHGVGHNHRCYNGRPTFRSQ